MSHFSDAEIEYMRSQRLGRLATVNQAGELHVVPVSFRYNAELEVVDIGGRGMSHSKKFRDVLLNANVGSSLMMCFRHGSHASLRYEVKPSRY